MENFNGKELLGIMEIANELNINFEIRVTTAQGIKGVYLYTEKSIPITDINNVTDYANLFLVQEIYMN